MDDERTVTSPVATGKVNDFPACYVPVMTPEYLM